MIPHSYIGPQCIRCLCRYDSVSQPAGALKWPTRPSIRSPIALMAQHLPDMHEHVSFFWLLGPVLFYSFGPLVSASRQGSTRFTLTRLP